jgi:Rod binding domain-containing protein
MAVGRVTGKTARASLVTQDLAKLRETADKLVGSVFYGTMLKAMRNSKIKGPYGHGGRGEEVFGAQLDGLYAEQMGRAQHSGLQQAVYRTLEKQQRAMSEAYARVVENRVHDRPLENVSWAP